MTEVYPQTRRADSGSLCQTTGRMNNVVKLERQSEAADIAVIVIDNPPVNAIGQDVYEGLLDTFEALAGSVGECRRYRRGGPHIHRGRRH